jgi:2-oxoisovalerate dehydrogenase E2 component (dihydrolipoyl transacylase)
MAVREFLLPDLGEGLEDAEVVTWRVAEGDRVGLNQTLVEVNTAKALVEIPAPWEGVIEKLHAAEGDVVKVGAALVSILVEEDASHEPAVPEAEEDGGGAPPKRRAVLVGYGVADDERPADVPAPPAARRGPAERRGPVPASPPVRRLAKELAVDLASVTGTGPGGRVTREDVESAAREGGVELISVRGNRRLIAEHMTRSVTEIPHVTTFLTVDCTWLMAFREELSSRAGERISPLPLVVRALVEVIEGHPKLNASFGDGSEIALYPECHVGIATDTEDGLLVPVIHHTGRLGILEIAHEIARLSEAARSQRIKLEDMTGGTITVTNVGTFGSEFGTPIINHPQAAILAFGVIEPRALVVEGTVVGRPAATLSLSFDHRVMDGAEAGRALRALGDLLESPFDLGALPR